MCLLIGGRLLALQLTNMAFGRVGNLELVRPNFCRYKLLMLSYLQLFNRIPSAENIMEPPVRYNKVKFVQLLPSAPFFINTPIFFKRISTRYVILANNCLITFFIGLVTIQKGFFSCHFGLILGLK